MRSRCLHVLFTFATLVAAALMWLVPRTASASEASSVVDETPSFSATFLPQILHTPASDNTTPVAPAPIGPLPGGAATALGDRAPSDKAPLCDPRGAITFAPAPQMQDLEVTLDTGLTLDDCLGTTHGSDVNQVAPGRSPLPRDAQSASSDAAILHVAVVLAASGRELLPAPGPSTTCSRPGIRSTVDRPPRA